MADEIDPAGNVETTTEPPQEPPTEPQTEPPTEPTEPTQPKYDNTGEIWHCGQCRFRTRNLEAHARKENGEWVCPRCRTLTPLPLIKGPKR